MADKKPIILSVDDDPQVLRSLRSDLRRQYRDAYRILSVSDPQEALDSLPELKKRGEEVALFLSDQRMPQMLGVEFLERAKQVYPQARRVLLTAYSDIQAAIRAINDVQLDYYLLKPWDPPNEKLYPILDDLLEEWQAIHLPVLQGLRLIGLPYHMATHQIKDFLAGNLLPYVYLDARADGRAKDLMELFGHDEEDLPVILLEDGTTLARPDLAQVAKAVGMTPEARAEVYDVVIVGAGPAGLAAGVYGGSEGLSTVMVEKRAPGGQAGTSSRIENYLGFPNGLSGAELSRRALAQATRFGVEFVAPMEVERISIQGPYKTLHLKDGQDLQTRSVVIASGMTYRLHPATGVDQLAGAGVYYGAATTEARACQDREVVVVGGGNSAGQGAVYLSQFARQVTILIRRPDLTATMSSYLIDQIDAIPNIQVQGYTDVIEALGQGTLTGLRVRDKRDGVESDLPAQAMFVFIGTRPNTDWLGDQVLRDPKGFLLTGRDVVQAPQFRKIWREDRDPFLLETCVPGVFAVGDVRSGAMNRVASAVGEGAMAIKFVHEYLALS